MCRHLVLGAPPAPADHPGQRPAVAGLDVPRRDHQGAAAVPLARVLAPHPARTHHACTRVDSVDSVDISTAPHLV